MTVFVECLGICTGFHQCSYDCVSIVPVGSEMEWRAGVRRSSIDIGTVLDHPPQAVFGSVMRQILEDRAIVERSVDRCAPV